MSLINSEGIINLPGVKGYDLSDLKAIVHFKVLKLDKDNNIIFPEGYTEERYLTVTESPEFIFLYKIAAKCYIVELKQQEKLLQTQTENIKEEILSIPEVYKKHETLIEQQISALQLKTDVIKHQIVVDKYSRNLNHISVLLHVIHIFANPTIVVFEIPIKMTSIVVKLIGSIE